MHHHCTKQHLPPMTTIPALGTSTHRRGTNLVVGSPLERSASCYNLHPDCSRDCTMPTFTKRSNGWRAQVRRRGKSESATFPTKSQAQIWAQEVEARILSGKYLTAPDVTFGKLAQRYAIEVSPTKRGEAWEQKRLLAFESDPLASVSLSDLNSAHVSEWRDRRLKTVTGSTVNREWNLLSHVCRVAVNEWKWLAVNPFSTVRRPKEAMARTRLPTADEIEALRIASGYHDGELHLIEQRVFAAFLFAIETGMRSGEICDLADVRGRVAYLPMTKNGTAREVPLSPEALRIWQQVGKFDLSASQRDSVWRKIRNKAGVIGLTFHDSRAEAITRLSKKLSVLELAKMIGHKNINELQTYYRESADDIAGKL